MPRSPAAPGRRGRRGRRTALTVRAANERIRTLFRFAATEASRGNTALSGRYVGLARTIGTRYNVRLPVDLRDRCCRTCHAYWVEGATVRTRLRAGRRVRTCIVCGAIRRAGVGPKRPRRSGSGAEPERVAPGFREVAFADDSASSEEEGAEAEGEEGE